MHLLTKGANAPLSADALSIDVEWDAVRGPGDLDVSALLLDGDGQVADDADFVFFNAPRHRSGAVVLTAATAHPRRSLVVDLARLPAAIQVVAVVVSADGATIRDDCAIVCSAVDIASGDPLARYELTGTSSETAVLLAELYRRDGRWKVRAVGQGWDAGLAALATEYGVVVDAPGNVEAVPPAAEQPPPQAPRPIELLRGDAAVLPDAGDIELALSWEVARPGRRVLLDADAVVTDRSGRMIGTVGSRHADPIAGLAMRAGAPAQHVFAVRLAAVPADAAAVAFTLTSFGGQRFTEIARAAFDLTGPRTVVRGAFTERPRLTGVLLLRLERAGPQTWRAVAVGEHADARRGVELVTSG